MGAPPLPTPSARPPMTPRAGMATPFRTATSKHRLHFPRSNTHHHHGGAATEHPVEVICRVRNLTPSAADASALEVPTGTMVRVGGCRDFSLDGVSLSEEEDLEGFYRRFVRSRIEGVRVGAKCTVMVYGPTGSGKTHTMFGCAEQPGIIYRALRDILDGGGGCGEGGEDDAGFGVGLSVELTVLEIYNEEIYDLLVGSGANTKGNTPKVRLEVMGKKAKNATYIPGDEAGKILKEVAKVEKRCTVKSTLCNERSSRSHCMIILDVPSVGGRLMLVDMAGSENIEAAGQIGFEAKMQTAKINQANAALKRVVESIANGDSHIPFRDSKLTMLLQDSFEDEKSKILMILCVSPDPKELHKTVSTLEYGAKAKCIIRASHASTLREKMNYEESSSMHQLQFIDKLQKECKEREKERNEAWTVLLHKDEELVEVRAKLQLMEGQCAAAKEEAKMMAEKMLRHKEEDLAEVRAKLRLMEWQCAAAKEEAKMMAEKMLRHKEEELTEVRAKLRLMEVQCAAAKEEAKMMAEKMLRHKEEELTEVRAKLRLMEVQCVAAKEEAKMMAEKMLRQQQELLALTERLQEVEREKSEAHQPVQQDIVGGMSEMAAGGQPAMSMANEAGAEPERVILKKRTALTLQQREKVDEKVQAIECEFSIFVTLITERNINLYRMEFAMKYAKAYLPKDEKQHMFLQVEGKRKQWRTTLNVYYKGDQDTRQIRGWEIHEGWKDFVTDNHVEEGDICLFELVERSTKGVRMRVHLIRKSEIDS